MKKFLKQFSLVLAFAIVAGFLSSCTLSEPTSPSEEKTPTLQTSCEAANGTWLAENKECEYVSQDWCNAQGGEFKECESACRHDPEAMMCTMQCVIVCKL